MTSISVTNITSNKYIIFHKKKCVIQDNNYNYYKIRLENDFNNLDCFAEN